MLMSKKNQEAFDATFKTISAVSARLLNSSVRLKGKTPKGSDFYGSGAMLFGSTSDSSAVLVTAKHNLEVYMEAGPRPDINAAAASFQKNVKIYYEAAMAFNTDPTQVADITSVELVQADSTGDWDYDVVILRSSDATLFGLCSANPIYPIGVKGKAQPYLDVVTNPKMYLSKGSKDNAYYFIQTGFGNVTDTVQGKTLPLEKSGSNKKGGLQYRTTAPLGEATTTVYNQEGDSKIYDQYDRVIQLFADANNSTAQGDSGGPLFLTYYDKSAKGWGLYLIGVTTGGDMATDREPCPPKGKLVVNNISTSLEYCYANGQFY